MLSVVLAIASGVMLLAGVAYLVFTYFPKIVAFINTSLEIINAVSSALPSWLLPFVGISLLVAVIGILIKIF